MEKRKRNSSVTLFIIGCAMVLVAGIFSPAKPDSGGASGMEKEEGQILTQENADEEAARKEAVKKEAAQTEAARAETAASELLTDGQNAFYSRIFTCLQKNDLAGAARLLEMNKEVLEKLSGSTLGEKRYLYNESGITDMIEGHGLVLISPSTLFYGNFHNGEPQGHGLALMTLVLEKPRYDYSLGMWKDGKMNGEGITGYMYYGEIGDGDGLKTEKSGFFRDDLMQGELRYTSINAEGDSATWKISADSGVTVLDQRWTYQKKEAAYLLAAENNEEHVYRLDDADTKTSMWKNRILWEN